MNFYTNSPEENMKGTKRVTQCESIYMKMSRLGKSTGRASAAGGWAEELSAGFHRASWKVIRHFMKQSILGVHSKHNWTV